MYVAQLTDEATLRAWSVSPIICELYAGGSWIGLVHDEEFTLPASQIVLGNGNRLGVEMPGDIGDAGTHGMKRWARRPSISTGFTECFGLPRP